MMLFSLNIRQYECMLVYTVSKNTDLATKITQWIGGSEATSQCKLCKSHFHFLKTNVAVFHGCVEPIPPGRQRTDKKIPLEPRTVCLLEGPTALRCLHKGSITFRLFLSCACFFWSWAHDCIPFPLLCLLSLIDWLFVWPLVQLSLPFNNKHFGWNLLKWSDCLLYAPTLQLPTMLALF